MANGENHAKQIVLDEAAGLAKDLQNGGAGDAETQGRAIALLVKMISPLYSADFVTQDICRKQHEALTLSKKSKIKLGPIEFEGCVNPTQFLITMGVLSGFVFVIGKVQNWW